MPLSQWGLGKVITRCWVKMLCTDFLWGKCGYLKGSPAPQLHKIRTNLGTFNIHVFSALLTLTQPEAV